MSSVPTRAFEPCQRRIDPTTQSQVGHEPAIAAALQTLAQLNLDEGRADEARTLLDEAVELATASGAHRTLQWIQTTREVL
jgi:hypothetical protein